MKKKIYISYPMNEIAAEKVKRNTPDLHITTNGEEVLAMARAGEVDKVCIVFGAFAFYELDLSKAIHAIDPTIPVLIMGSEVPETPSANEYVTTDPGFFFESVNEFLNGEFTKEDYRLFPKEYAF
jgi:hypothetical protein